MIAVFDTNVLIAAIITEGVCSKLLTRAHTREFSLVLCPFIMTEIRRILSKKFRLSPEETASAIELIIEATGQVIKHGIKVTNICRDSDDNHVLACAFAANAQYLVTGDNDLLELKNFQDIRILSPREFELLFD